MTFRNTLTTIPNETASTICSFAAYTGTVICFSWFTIFIYLKNYEPAFSLIVLGVAILPCWYISVNGRFSQGILLSQLACLIFVIFFCVMYDVPRDIYQRTTHLYLPVIALVGYLNYQTNKSPWQLAIILSTLIAFVFFCSHAPTSIIDNRNHRTFQTISSWLNPILSTFLLFGGIVAIQYDFTQKKYKYKCIQEALYNNQFVLFYQPIVNKNGHVIGAEALIRWQHPTKGLLPPSYFIQDAEKSGLMPMIGEWVISQAVTDLLSWQEKEEMKELTLSINLTIDHFMQPDFSKKLKDKIHTGKIPAWLIKFELTEGVFISQPEVVADKINELVPFGFRFSLDDFGTGFSCLSTLRTIPLEQIKIDRSFISAALESEKGFVIAKSIIRMGRELNLEVVAEGIETNAQWALMREQGCTKFQGFLFSPPLTEHEYVALALKQSLNIESS